MRNAVLYDTLHRMVYCPSYSKEVKQMFQRGPFELIIIIRLYMNIDTDTCNSRVHTIKCEYPMGAELIIISTIMCNYILCLSSIYRRTFFSKLLY